MKKILLVLAVLVVLGGIYYFFFYGKTKTNSSNSSEIIGSSSLEAPVDGNGNLSQKLLRISSTNGKTHDFRVEIAQSSEELGKGLMHRQSLPQDQGMLFIFAKTELQHFWMKNTLIPLDIVFIGENYKIVHILKNAPPCLKSQCDIYSSVYPARYVVEINGGSTDKLGIKEGDIVKW